nr:MAG TPA: hypothetical protein [Caudoviricetes sp.]
MDEKFLRDYNEFVVEDEEHIIPICSSAIKILYEKFKVPLKDPKLVAVIVERTYKVIINLLKSYETKLKEFKINLCDRVEFSYSTDTSDDDEKQGNYVIAMTHLNKSIIDTPPEEDTSSTERITQWNIENVITQPGIIREISNAVIEDLKTIDVHIGISELVMPIFITVYECIVNYVRIKRQELNEFEFEINFVSCFHIGCMETEDGSSIYIRPNIEAKLLMKDDQSATSIHE